MTKKLEELLNLPEAEKKKNAKVVVPDETMESTTKQMRSIAEFDKIAASLPQVDGLGQLADKELDELAQKAVDAYDDLMDLGMNVEARYGARMFEVASSMLKNAIDAKVAKIDKKLQMVQLQLKKQQLDQKQGIGDGDSGIMEGKGYIVADRNSLIEKLKNMNK